MVNIVTSDDVFSLPDGANLLHTLEQLNYAVEYQCREGYCGVCRLKLLSGSVSYDETPMAFVMADEILPCCCRVETDLQIVCHVRQPESHR